METEFLKETFLGMLQVMQADLDKLSEIADNLAKEEAMTLHNNGRSFYTTPPAGQNVSYKVGEIRSKLTVPLAMTCFSIMDLLGKILTSNVVLQDDDSSKDLGAFIKHARAFEKLAGKDYLKNDDTAQIFQDAFRHSIAHGFLPGATSKIAFHVSYHYELWVDPLILRHDAKEYVLNVKCLAATTKTVVDKLVDMASQKDNTEELEQILVAFDKVVTETEEKLNHLDS